MSDAIGAVRFPDGLVLFCEYAGSVDVMRPRLFASREQVWDHWREVIPQEEWFHFACDQDEAVDICSTYGGGFAWKGRACRTCMKITAHREPHETDRDTTDAVYSNGLPDWYPT